MCNSSEAAEHTALITVWTCSYNVLCTVGFIDGNKSWGDQRDQRGPVPW